MCVCVCVCVCVNVRLSHQCILSTMIVNSDQSGSGCVNNVHLMI